MLTSDVSTWQFSVKAVSSVDRPCAVTEAGNSLGLVTTVSRAKIISDNNHVLVCCCCLCFVNFLFICHCSVSFNKLWRHLIRPQAAKDDDYFSTVFVHNERAKLSSLRWKILSGQLNSSPRLSGVTWPETLRTAQDGEALLPTLSGRPHNNNSNTVDYRHPACEPRCFCWYFENVTHCLYIASLLYHRQLAEPVEFSF